MGLNNQIKHVTLQTANNQSKLLSVRQRTRINNREELNIHILITRDKTTDDYTARKTALRKNDSVRINY